MSILNPLLALLVLQPADATITRQLQEGPSSPPAPAPAPAVGPRGTARQRGLDLFIPGALITAGLAAPLLVAGPMRLAAARRCQQLHDGDCLGTIGGGLLTYLGALAAAIGLPLLAIGAHRLRVWRRWQRQNGFALGPQLGRGRNAWSIGIELRF